MPDACFCEAVRSDGVRQPANTWSSLGFVVVAVIIVLRWRRARPLTSGRGASSNRDGAYSLLFAFALLVVGLGSAVFHATLSFNGQLVDVIGMYLVATFALIYNFDRLRSIRASTVIISFIAINAVLALILYTAPVFRRMIFGFLIAGVLVIEVAIHRRGGHTFPTKHIRYAVGLVCVAFGVWILDYTRIVCSPESWLQGHAVWHLLGAWAAWHLYLYYQAQSSSFRSSRANV